MLFIGNLPRLARESELTDVFRLSPFDKHRVRIVNKLTREGQMVRFGLFQPASDQEANRWIQKSGKVGLNGTFLQIREFVKRVAGNDRRRPEWRSLAWPHAERRVSERRAQQSIAA